MKEITIEKMKELEAKPEFIRDLKATTSTSEVASVMEKYGIDITEEEIKEGYFQAKGILEEQGYLESGEFSAKSLEMVTGGLNVPVYMVGLLMAAGIAVSPWLWVGGLIVMSGAIFMKG